MTHDRSRIHPRRAWAAAGLFLTLGVVVGLALAASFRLQPELGAQDATHALNTAASTLPGANGESPFVAVVDHALPAVVSIDTRRKVGQQRSDFPDNDLFRRFFGDPPGGGRRNFTVPSSGSGFIIDGNGRILTNNHVVREASEITVTLYDKRQFKARVVGQDPATDVAVIEINAPGALPALPLGDSDAIRVGEWVLAIGNPLGELEGTVTSGIVSARGRSQLNIAGGAPDYQDFIQTDASINFGNSGGPLVNMRGEAIGINTAINAQGQGIGFAIPINLARHIAEQLVANGKVVRGFLGVVPAELTPDLAASYGVSPGAGVIVQEVSDNSPASRAGLKRGDLITSFDGARVGDVTQFRLKVADTPVDKRVTVAVLRDGKTMNLQVTLANRDVMLAQATGRGGDSAPGESQEGESATDTGMGVTVRDLSASEREVLGSDVRALVVSSVEPGSPAADAGIEEGDLIFEANGDATRNAADLGAAVREAKRSGRPMRVLVGYNVDWTSGRYASQYRAVKFRE